MSGESDRQQFFRVAKHFIHDDQNENGRTPRGPAESWFVHSSGWPAELLLEFGFRFRLAPIRDRRSASLTATVRDYTCTVCKERERFWTFKPLFMVRRMMKLIRKTVFHLICIPKRSVRELIRSSSAWLINIQFSSSSLMIALRSEAARASRRTFRATLLIKWYSIYKHCHRGRRIDRSYRHQSFNLSKNNRITIQPLPYRFTGMDCQGLSFDFSSVNAIR